MIQVDSAADFLVPEDRSHLEYPAPFGRDATAEEAKIAELDGRTGASLKVGVILGSARENVDLVFILVAKSSASSF